MYTVYRHVAPNGKMYVGITSSSLKRRWEYGHGYKHNDYFSKAIAKYGWDNFAHEILATGLTKEQAEAKERELIAKYRTNDKKYGYNLTDGGEIGKRHAQESIDKMRIAKIGKYDGEKNPRYGVKLSDETKRKMSNAMKGKMAGDKNPNYHKPMSSEQKAKLSIARKGKHFPKLSEAIKNSLKVKESVERQKKKVDQYELSGEFVKTWDSAADASNAILGHRRGQCNICSCATGNLKTAYGFKWKHHSESSAGGGGKI